MNPNEEYVTETRAMQILDIHWRRMKRMREDGTLPVVLNPHDGRMRLVAMSDIRAYQAKNIPKSTYHRKKAPPRKRREKQEVTV